MDLDKKRIEQPVEPITVFGIVWLWCPTPKPNHLILGYWQYMSATLEVRVIPPLHATSGAWTVMRIVKGAENRTFGFAGADAKELAFRRGAELTEGM